MHIKCKLPDLKKSFKRGVFYPLKADSYEVWKETIHQHLTQQKHALWNVTYEANSQNNVLNRCVKKYFWRDEKISSEFAYKFLF